MNFETREKIIKIETEIEKLKSRIEDLECEKSVYDSYEVLEDLVAEAVECWNRILEPIYCKNGNTLRINLWRVEDVNAEANDWDLTVNFFNEDFTKEIEIKYSDLFEYKDIFDNMLDLFTSFDEIIKSKTDDDIRYRIQKNINRIIETMVREMIRKL